MNSKSLVIFLAVAILAAAHPRTSAKGSRVSPVRVVVSYDKAQDERPEGVATDRFGNLYVSLPTLARIERIDLSDPAAPREVLPVFAPGVLGLVTDFWGNIYAAVNSGSPETRGVLRISPDGSHAERLPGSELITFPNALVFDERSNLYVTDTIEGLIWRIPPSGAAEVWLHHPLLEGIESLPGFPALGANGIAYRRRTIYVANTTRGQVLGIRVLRNGSPGVVSSIAGGVYLDDEGNLAGDFSLWPLDGIAVDLLGNLYVLKVGSHELVRICRKGSRLTVLADQADGLDFPTSVAFGAWRQTRTTVFITNFSLQPGLDSPAVLKLHVGAPGPPVRGREPRDTAH